MELIWHRPRYNAGVTDGYSIAPYGKIHERQIDVGLDSIREGSESIVDYNLYDSESIIRNHMYSRRWLREKFDYVPTLLCCAFGIEKAIDPTENVFRFELSADEELAEAYRCGMKLNSRFLSVYAEAKKKLFSLPSGAILTA